MKKFMILITLVALILVTATYVSAKSPNAAIVVHGDWCLAPDGSGSFDPDDLWYFEDCCTTVITNSTKGNAIISCQAQLPEDAVYPEKTLLLNYKNTEFECWWDENTTTQKYLFTITPTGHASFHCVFEGVFFE